MKAVYTTGEAADICKVSQQTIIRCFDKGRLKGFRVPGSRFRRIPRAALISFMKEHGIPLDALETGRRKILIIGNAPQVADSLVKAGQFEIRQETDAFAAGLAVRDFNPDLVVVGQLSTVAEQIAVCRYLRDLQDTQPMRIAAITKNSNSQMEQFTMAGCQIVGDPTTLAQKLLNELEEAYA